MADIKRKVREEQDEPILGGSGGDARSSQQGLSGQETRLNGKFAQGILIHWASTKGMLAN